MRIGDIYEAAWGRWVVFAITPYIVLHSCDRIGAAVIRPDLEPAMDADGKLYTAYRPTGERNELVHGFRKDPTCPVNATVSPPSTTSAIAAGAASRGVASATATAIPTATPALASSAPTAPTPPASAPSAKPRSSRAASSKRKPEPKSDPEPSRQVDMFASLNAPRAAVPGSYLATVTMEVTRPLDPETPAPSRDSNSNAADVGDSSSELGSTLKKKGGHNSEPPQTSSAAAESPAVPVAAKTRKSAKTQAKAIQRLDPHLPSTWDIVDRPAYQPYAVTLPAIADAEPLTLGGTRPGTGCVPSALQWVPCLTRVQGVQEFVMETHLWFLSSGGSFYCPPCREIERRAWDDDAPGHEGASGPMPVANPWTEYAAMFPWITPPPPTQAYPWVVVEPASSVTLVTWDATAPSPFPFVSRSVYQPPTRAAWREEFNERAAIIEYDGGLPRRDAEELAWDLLGPEPVHEDGDRK